MSAEKRKKNNNHNLFAKCPSLSLPNHVFQLILLAKSERIQISIPLLFSCRVFLVDEPTHTWEALELHSSIPRFARLAEIRGPIESDEREEGEEREEFARLACLDRL